MSQVSRTSRPRKWTWLLLATLTVIAAVVAVYAVQTVSPARSMSTGQMPGAVTPEPAVSTIVVLGDDHVATDVVDDGKTWPSLLEPGDDWAHKELAVEGAGYLARPTGSECTSTECPNLLDLVPEVVALNADVVVVAAGSVDAGQTPGALEIQMASVYRALQVGLPKATIVAVGPSAVDPAEADVLALDGLVRRAASDASVEYVSLLAPPVITDELLNADGELRAAGQNAIATRVRTGLPD